MEEDTGCISLMSAPKLQTDVSKTYHFLIRVSIRTAQLIDSLFSFWLLAELEINKLLTWYTIFLVLLMKQMEKIFTG